MEAKVAPKVAIIVLNWNGWRDTIECLESLQRITYPNYQVIVVDNGSTDNSVEQIKAWARREIEIRSKFFTGSGSKATIVEYTCPEAGGVHGLEGQLEMLPSAQRLVLIRNKENLGFAAGNNVAIRYALLRHYPYIGLLNNDTIVDPDFLRVLIQTLENNPHWMAVLPKILDKDTPTRIWYAGGKLKLWRANAMRLGIKQNDNSSWTGERETGCVTGCCLIARKSWFENVGLLDEDFFFGIEDWAHSWVAKKCGLLFGVNLDAKIYHKCAGSLEEGNPIYAYYYNKNRLLILKKHGSLVEQVLGFSFYAFTRPIKFVGLLLRGRIGMVRAELRAVRDFLAARYGDYDRKMANAHV